MVCWWLQTQSLEEERDYYRATCERQQQEMLDLKERYEQLELEFRSLNAQLGISNISSLQVCLLTAKATLFADAASTPCVPYEITCPVDAYSVSSQPSG